MKFLSINGALSYPIRIEMFEGRRHIVVPVVALVEGVHVGSAGAFFYPWEEISKYPASWNGTPVPVYHPESGGTPVSANSPRIIEQRSIGRVFNVVAEGGKLSGELWLDEEKTRLIAPDVLAKIQDRQPIEVSTGFFSDLASEAGTWQGENYEATVINIRPDHIAILPAAVGACSVADGCGVRANVRASARTPSFEGTESVSWASVDKSFGAYSRAYYMSHGGMPQNPATSVADCPAAMRNWMASKTLLGDGGADNERDLLMFPVVNPKNGKLNEGALRAVIGGRGSAADIPAAAKTSAQNKARALLNRHFNADLETNEGKESLMRKILNKIGETVSGLMNNETSYEDIGLQLRQWADKQDTVERINWVRDVYDGYFVHEVSVRDPATGNRIANKLYRRSYSINDNGQVEIGDDPVEVVEKKEYVPVETPNANINTNQEEKQNMKKKEEMVSALIACNSTRLEESDRPWLLTLSEDQLDKLRAMDPPAPATNAQTLPPAPPEPKPALKPITLEQYIKDAPPEVAGALTRMIANEKAAKAKIIEQIVANNKDCPFTKEELEGKGLEELSKLASLAKIEVNIDYSGAAGGPPNQPKRGAPVMPQVTQPAVETK